MTPRSLARVLRTARHIRLRQGLAQLHRAVVGKPEPVTLSGGPPALAVAPGACAPFLPAPDHARFDGERSVCLIDREVRFEGEIDWDFSEEGPLWAYHLHQFDYARSPVLTARQRTALVLDWVERHPRGTGWNPHPICLRALSWGKLLLTPGALALDAESEVRALASLGQQIANLAGDLEVRLQANHLLSNLIGVVWGGLLLAGPEPDRWLAFEEKLRRELVAQVRPDGGHEERSPMYHALLLENVLDLLNLARAAGGRTPPGLEAELERVAARMLGALRLWTHPDGEIALFADSAFGIAHRPAVIEDYAASLGLETHVPPDGVLPETGFVRLEAGPFALIASVAGPSPPHQPGHAHCDALAFELSVERQRIVTDTGVKEYVPGAARTHCRRTRAHATIEVGGVEQAEIWSAHRVGGRPQVRLGEVTPWRAAIASCVGWSTGGTRHRRRFEVSESGVEVHDAIEGRARPVRMSLPLAPDLDVRLAGGELVVALPGGRVLRVELPQGVEWRVESAPYFPRFSREVSRACVVGEAAEFRVGVWRFTVD